MNLLRIYSFPLFATILIWGLSLAIAGWHGFTLVALLTLLEVTFSADNAVVNSKVVATLSPLWQRLFMTVGIIVAVFVVRFLLPIFIVMLGAHLSFTDVVQLALHEPERYAHYLDLASPSINAFGGSFLLLIALSYFIDYQKKTHWLGWLERNLGLLGRFDNFTTFVMLVASILLYVTVEAEAQTATLLAAIVAIATHTGLGLLNAFFEQHSHIKAGSKLVGWAGLGAFLYLEVLDMSFSLDGVIGAFAITDSVFLIMAGLGAGAVWIRSMTVHLVRSNTLQKYIYLEHGAHWAIAFLGAVMILKLYHLELPEWIIGMSGLVVIILAIFGSRRPEEKRVRRTAH